MPTIDDIVSQPSSGMDFIDALLDVGPGWNYRTLGGNTIYYTFSVTSGNQASHTGQLAFTAAQQTAARGAFAYLSQLTGIQFKETVIGSSADIHLCNLDLPDADTSGLCSWNYSYQKGASGQVLSFAPEAWIYLDDKEWGDENGNLTPGGWGYETLLHELGHALGLKHPFDDTPVLDASLDNDNHTLMSYHEVGQPKAAYGELDVAALDWLYGGDGLRGTLGVNSTSGGYYVVGTGADDILYGEYGNDVLDGRGGNDGLWGGPGIDTAVFAGSGGSYTVAAIVGGIEVTDAQGKVTDLISVERLRFSDGTWSVADLLNDHTAPGAPTLALDGRGPSDTYEHGQTIGVHGQAEAYSLVTLWLGERIVDQEFAAADGSYSGTIDVPDGTAWHLHATAGDSAGNESAPSADQVFSVDTTPPAAPSAMQYFSAGGRQPMFSGIADAGSTVKVLLSADTASVAPFEVDATVNAVGIWSAKGPLLPNGTYSAVVESVDAAGNASYATAPLKFSVAATSAPAGTSGADVFLAGPGAESFDGAAGTDTVVYAGARAGYTVAHSGAGFTVSDANGAGGTDTLSGIERLTFADGTVALDVDGVAGQAYRLYRAAFDRAADSAGLGYWMARMEGGSSLTQVANEFMQQKEFAALYGSAPSDADFVTTLYQNVLHRAPEGAGFDYWMGALKQESRADVLVQFSESAENRDQVGALVGSGIAYTPWH